jgi:Predicted membrane protein (DUF2142)
MRRGLLDRASRDATKLARRSTRVRDPRAIACLAVGLLALALGLATALSHATQRRAGTNGVWPMLAVGEVAGGQRVCQSGELLPAGATAMRFALQPLQATGPRVVVTLAHGGRTLERASLALAARTGIVDTIRLAPQPHDVGDVDVCLDLRGRGRVLLVGAPTPPGLGVATVGDRQLGGSLSITYLSAGTRSWWRHAATVARRMALGRGDWGGTWVVWATGLLLIASAVLVVALLVRTVAGSESASLAAARSRRVPALAWAVAGVAVLNAAAWSLITPAFQVPDEQTHLAYAQQLAETGRPPVARRGDERIAPELIAAMLDTRFGTLEARTASAAVWSPVQQRRLARDLHAGLARRSENDSAGPAAPEPPLYYALEAIPYRVASGATLLDRLALMRLLSAAMAGVTALFVVLFLRECLPGRPWAWTVGALGAALTPTLGFVSGGVNPDALLFAVAAALFHALAVAFRRGLTTRRAVWIGAVLAVGLVGKINFYGLVPGALLAVVLAARASAGGLNLRAARLVGVAVAVAVVPFLVLTALDTLAWDRAFILARTPAEAPQSHGGLGGQFSYLWQVFLPRLPGQTTAFPSFYPGYALWLKGFVGRFGWTAVSYPQWAYRLAVGLLGAVTLLALRALLTARRGLRGRRGELAAYAAMAGGLLLLIGLVALRGFAPGIVGAVQGRYLLPLLALFAALLVLAARGAGRWGRAVGVALVLTCVAWGLFGQLLTIAWFYS